MAGQIKISTDQVAEIATSIENLNKRLDDTLKSSQTTVKNLNNSWEGEAANATISAFDSFANKYFQNYKDVIDAYVRFLRQNVESGYIETETANTKLAEAFE